MSGNTMTLPEVHKLLGNKFERLKRQCFPVEVDGEIVCFRDMVQSALRRANRQDAAAAAHRGAAPAVVKKSCGTTKQPARRSPPVRTADELDAAVAQEFTGLRRALRRFLTNGQPDPKASALIVAMSYHHLKELNEWLGSALKQLDHPRVSADLRRLQTGVLREALDGMKTILKRHHPNLTVDGVLMYLEK